MAIEPLGSIMSMQAQSVSAPRPVAQTREVSVETQSNTAQEAAQVDTTVNVVAESQSKGDAAGNSNEQQQQATNEKIKKAVEQLNKNLGNSEAVFGIHEATNRVTIKIVDKETKEIIKELPPEKTLDMIAKVWEMAGILVDERR